MSFEGKVILITAASSGISQACAEYFAKEKALFSSVGRNIERFDSVSENIKAMDVENEPLIIVADVSVDFERIISETIEKYQRLDVLINNAAFSIRGTLETTKIDDFDAMFTANLRGLFQLTQRAIPNLIESKGNIVNASSVVGLRAFPHSECHTTSGLDADAYPAVREIMGKIHPIGRVGRALEFFSAIAFVANENNSFMTGVTLPVDDQFINDNLF